MSSSSSPDPPEQPEVRLDLDDITADEAEAEHEQERALGVQQAARKERGRSWITLAWALPGFVWLAFYLIAPLVFIFLVSLWVRTDTGFDSGAWTLHNYGILLHPFNLNNAYWSNMWRSFLTSVIAVAACLVFGFPVAYFLAMKVQRLEYQIGLFIVALAPFWTSFTTRSVAWTYPLMGTYGALNRALVWLGISSFDHPLIDTQFSLLSVRLAMIQLYILFMVTPIFFLLSQVDQHAIEAARDLGGNWWRTFREVILPQTMPGIVIGSIFIFVLTMGEYGTVNVVSQGAVSSVGTYIQNLTAGIQYPQGAAAAMLLVIVLILGVFVITRFAKLREEI
jgi:putative spermidine/putrescine transport system permease protein